MQIRGAVRVGQGSELSGRVPATARNIFKASGGVSLAAIALGLVAPGSARAQATPASASPAVAAQAVAPEATASQGAGTAQNAPESAEGAQSEQADPNAIVVTGSRVARDGFRAPTPLTVVSRDQINTSAPENLADYVNEIPSVVGSQTPSNSNLSFSNGQSGLSALNLRGIGTARTLVLLDGQRSVPSAITGAVDINNIPQDLVERVEIVTGGASAAYGSDAVSGVVNFILDKKFTGVRGEVSQGITTYGDGPSWKASLSAGAAFAGGRGHVIVSGEISDRSGIYGFGGRKWVDRGWMVINNPAYTATNGQPERLLLPRVGNGTATVGGIITNTALKGIEFGPGGSTRQFNFGDLTSGPFVVGGDWQDSQVLRFTSLDQEAKRKSLFGRASFDITSNINAFVQVSWNSTDTRSWALRTFSIGNVIVKSGNPFIPASVQSRMTGLGISQFTLGTFHGDIPPITFEGGRTVQRYVAGLNGKFDISGHHWSWDAYYQKGITNSSETGLNVYNKANFAKAIDVVRSPTGQAVCAVNADANPANDDPACVPYNVMGTGVNSQAAVNYVLGAGAHPHRDQRFTQDVAAASIRGEPFNIWAGPVSLALGVEHRREAVSGSSDAISQANGWFAGNYLPTFGSYKVDEGFAETVVPIIKGLDLNAAVRETHYSTSGWVTTWKGGVSFQPIPDIRFRATRSRDIRAPNLNELFAAGTANTNTVVDPFNGNQVVQYQGFQTGNRALKPEIADSLGAGVVVQPSFLRGFSASADYYVIKIKDAIGSVGAQTIVDRCFGGDQTYCAVITRGAGAGGAQVIQRIQIAPFNLVQERYRGLDIEASYRTRLADLIPNSAGDLTLRFLGTRYFQAYTNNGIVPPTDAAGQNSGNGPPKFVYRASVTYHTDDVTLNLVGRGLSSGTYLNSNIECSTNCPTSTVNNRTVNNNHIAGAFYMDASVTFRLGNPARHTEFFLSVENLANKDPAVVAQGPGGIYFGTAPANPTFYDVLGRTFRVGIRFQR